MVSIKEQIKDAIQVISRRRAVFALEDVAAYANLEGAEKTIRQALQLHCGEGELLNLGRVAAEPASDSLYIRKLEIERWWVRQTLRWSGSRVNYLTASQLAGAMSLAFGGPRWATPPQAVLEVGRRWAVVDDGSLPGTYVSPWASILRVNPQFTKTFCSIFDPESPEHHLKNQFDEIYQQDKWERAWADSTLVNLDQSAIVAAVDEALRTLKDREAEVIRRRFGLEANHKDTLEEVATDFGVTRERIRQIEKKALKNLKDKSAWYYGFAAYFIRSGGSLLISESEKTPQWQLLSKSIELNTVHIPQLGLCIWGATNGLTGYLSYLYSVPMNDEPERPIFEELQFLPLQDEMRLRADEQEYLDMRKNYLAEESIRTLPRMAFQALRSIGRAAHYQEIADECNRMFPERQTSMRNWHAVLSRPESLELGIVWIGRRGTYGLEEHGYSKPTRDLFEAVASIVEDRFAHTGQPVPFDFVMRELTNERQDPDPSSVNIALSINDRLASRGNSRYVPKAHSHGEPDAPAAHYDLDAGFDAFLAGTDNG